MDTYIVLDLEWNQSPEGKESSNPNIPFEIIEIGAVKLDEKFSIIDEFQSFISPVVYTDIHFKVCEVINLSIEELKKQGKPFGEVIDEFIEWIFIDGQNPIFCTWGNMDITELQRNMGFHGIENRFIYPLLYYDIQKLFYILYQKRGDNKLPLDKAVENMQLDKSRAFHNALDDAYYTSLIMRNMDFISVKEYMSLDYYNTPKNRAEEIYLVFSDYSKYVSKPFICKEDAIADKNVTDMVCYKCKRMLKKRLKWFLASPRNYYCLAYCTEHGYMKGKIRMKPHKDGGFYVIKTMKLIDELQADMICDRKEETKKKRREKNRIKKLKAEKA